MPDSYDRKRGMMSDLLAMLRKHASDEIDSGLQKPEGAGEMAGVQVEKVEILPDHEMDEPTPVHEVDTKMVPEHKDSVLDALETREPAKKDHSAPEADVSDEDAGEDGNFPMLFGKKRKK